jgi:hypothetical protein
MIGFFVGGGDDEGESRFGGQGGGKAPGVLFARGIHDGRRRIPARQRWWMTCEIPGLHLFGGMSWTSLISMLG